MGYILTVDIGTTSVKAVLFDENANIISKAMREYSLFISEESRVELPGYIYWDTCSDCIRKAVAEKSIHGDDIKVMTVTTQGETFLTLDDNGTDTGNAIVWMDNRALLETELLSEKFGRDTFFSTTGLGDISPGWPACKFLWLKRNEPERFENTHKFLLLQDYILYRLTGEYVSEMSNASSSGCLDISREIWWPEMLEYLGISNTALGKPVRSGTIIGSICKNVADELGLGTKTLVVAGAYDQAASAIGGGNIRPGIVTETTGTALVVVKTIDKPDFEIDGSITYLRHCIPGRYMALAYSQTAGILLKWFKDQFCQTEIVSAGNRDIYRVLDEMAASVHAGSDGLLLYPHFAGKTSPNVNSKARGMFSGITLQHTKAHFVRSILESVAYMLRENVEYMEKADGPVTSVFSMGGGAKSNLWGQIKANVLNRPVNILECSESTSLGAAVLAGIAAGMFSDIDEACRQLVRVKSSMEPNPLLAQEYRNLYMCFKASSITSSSPDMKG